MRQQTRITFQPPRRLQTAVMQAGHHHDSRRCDAVPAASDSIQLQFLGPYKVIIKEAVMPEHMIHDAVDCANKAMEQYSREIDIADHIRNEFDKLHKPAWNCVVGRHFSCSVKHKPRRFLHFQVNKKAVILFGM